MTQNRQRGRNTPAAPTAPVGPPQAPPTQAAECEPTTAPEDPLAAFRDPEDTSLPTLKGEDPEDPEDPPPGLTVVPLVTQERQDEARAQVVAAWHADPTSVGFLHKGGGCGCSFIAGLALQTAMPVELDDVDTANLTDPEE